jgi:hypothetical protein
MLVVKRRMNTIKQHGKGDNARQKSHSSLKIIIQKTLLKAYSMSTCIKIQSRCRLRRVMMPKKMVS